jgi:hypothetical protein
VALPLLQAPALTPGVPHRRRRRAGGGVAPLTPLATLPAARAQLAATRRRRAALTSFL